MKYSELSPEQKDAMNKSSASYKARKKDPALKAAYEAEKISKREHRALEAPEKNKKYFREWAVANRKKMTPDEKEIHLAKRRDWSNANKEKVAGYAKKSRAKPESKVRIREYGKKRREENPKKIKKWIDDWREKNPEKTRKHARDTYNRHKNEPTFKMAQAIRSRLGLAMKAAQAKKFTNSIKMLGCTLEELVAYFETLFTEGMNWQNMGRGGWEVDHIIPIRAFNLELPEEQLKANHYKNLQPLWCSDNRKKWDILPCGNLARDIEPGSVSHISIEEAKASLPLVIAKVTSPEERKEKQRKYAREYARKKRGINPKYKVGEDGLLIRKHLLTEEEKAFNRKEAVKKSVWKKKPKKKA